MKANKLILKTLLLGLGLAAIASKPLAAQTDIATQPLAQPASNVAPNIMLLLDDSGSMVQQYTPDYLGRYYGGSNALCFDSKDDDGNITTGLDNCEAGDPPLMSPDVNTQYYNPDIRYFPAVNYDASSMPSMTAANTSNWTAVPTDGVSLATRNDFRKDTYDMNNANQGTVSTANLVSNYPDRVWCSSQSYTATSDLTNLAECRPNGSYSYPDKNFGYGRNNSSTSGGQPRGPIKFVTGAPYYYRIIPTVYCTDYTLTSCVGGSGANAVTAPTGLYVIPAPVRYCNKTPTNNAANNTCKAKYQGSYTIPEFTGYVTGTSTPAVQATATITVPTQSDSFAGYIGGIYVKGVNIIGTSTISLSSGFTASAAATAIKNAINSNTSTNGGYTANISGSVVTITAPSCTTDCSTWNGASVSVQPSTSPAPVPVSATVTLTVSGASKNSKLTKMSAATSPAATSLISSNVTCPTCTSSSSASGNQSLMATAIANGINAGTSTTGYSAVASSNKVVITSPAGYGYNVALSTTTSNLTLTGTPSSTFAGGGVQNDVEAQLTNFANGTDYAGGRDGVGQFVRTNITPFQAGGTTPKTFPKNVGRSDCAGASTCTYDEEMTNFANWYAYYRMRDTMAKTAIGRAFSTLTNAYRVGFVTINPGNPVSSSLYLKVDTFNSGAGNQKDLWYQHVYNVKNNGSTPLREALSRVGRYYAGVQTGINNGMDPSPIQYSCQPNYTLAMTDGYWNGNGGQDLSGNAMGNQDNTDSGYHTRAIGAYDGNLNGATGTLADVAMYYYQTDLRSDLADNTPTTQTDPAPFQHMTTFTVGLGLAG
ncbi:MAG TPA: hypothetical protein VEI74_04560, partial [Candidatus Methylomirabilis sp.]|nr:hypothetical protein [Candidatus Methylomirabilis sp.]